MDNDVFLHYKSAFKTAKFSKHEIDAKFKKTTDWKQAG